MCLCTHAHAHQKNATKANSALPICIGDNRRRQKKFLSKNHPMHTTERKCREGVQLGQKFGQNADKKKKELNSSQVNRIVHQHVTTFARVRLWTPQVFGLCKRTLWAKFWDRSCSGRGGYGLLLQDLGCSLLVVADLWSYQGWIQQTWFFTVAVIVDLWYIQLRSMLGNGNYRFIQWYLGLSFL